MPSLPPSYAVDAPPLARLFHDRTNSYKYLFFLSLLDLVAAPRFDAATGRVTLRQLAAGMLARAYHPLRTFRLSLGRQDQLARLLEDFERRHGPLEASLSEEGFARLWRTFATAPDLPVQPLLRYVPTRLLRPFFHRDLAGLPDARVDDRIVGLAREAFDDRAPLYRLEGDALVLHPRWIEYLRAPPETLSPTGGEGRVRGHFERPAVQTLPSGGGQGEGAVRFPSPRRPRARAAPPPASTPAPASSPAPSTSTTTSPGRSWATTACGTSSPRRSRRTAPRATSSRP